MMTGKIVNLRTARKQKARASKRKAGDSAAARHGESAPDKAQREAERALSERRLDGHRRETDGDDER